MTRCILCSLILACSILTMNAQWNGTNPVWTNSNIGIGTTTPNARLDLGLGYGTSGAKLLLYNDNFTGELAGTKCGFYMDRFHMSNNSTYVFPTSTSNPGSFIMASKNTSSTDLIPRMTILGESGFVGVGTTTPNARLDLGLGYGTSGAKLLLYNDNFTDELAGTKCGFYMDNFRANNLNLVFPEAANNPGLFTVTAKNTSGTALNPYFSIVGLSGYVGIGTINPAYKLDVIGTIRAKEIKVDLNGADFVFEEDYKLMPLNELEKFVKDQKHLPEIASANQMETNGTELGKLNSQLLQKIEELTLYTIEQQKQIDELKMENVKLKNIEEKIAKLETLLK